METQFDEWAILELMGHRRLAGKVTDAVIGGGAFLRIDVPGDDGKFSTQYYSPGSVYCITPTSEEVARAVAKQSQPAPVQRWELPPVKPDSCACGECGVLEAGYPPPGWILSEPGFEDEQHWLCPKCQVE